LDAGEVVLWVAMLHHSFVETKDLFLVFEVKIEGAKFVHDFANYLSHSLDNLVVVVRNDESSKEVGDELLLNLLELQVLEDLQHGFDHFYAHVTFFIIEKLVDFGKVKVFKALSSNQLLSILLQVFFKEDCAVSPYRVICVLAHRHD